MANERLTWFEMDYDLSDVTALADSNPSSQYNQPWADLGLLKSYDAHKEYATYEHNFFILDGTKEEFPNNPNDIPFFSTEYGDTNGEFSQNPTIEINFSTYHSSFALTLYFGNSHPLRMNIYWYSDNDIIARGQFDIDVNTYIVKRDVQLYNKIVLEFTEVLPSYYVKLNYIRYGVLLLWNEENIKNGTLVQEMSRLSDRLANDTLSFEVVDVDKELNFGNSAGMHKYFQRNQPMHGYEWINGNKVPLGKYYLNKFSNESNLGKMSAVSSVGLLSNIQYENGQIYTGELAGEVLEDIFAVAGITDYSIDTDTYNQQLYGTIAPTTCRDAVKDVLFACHSIVDTTRLDTTRIVKESEAVLPTITRNDKISTKITKNEYISGINLTYTTYTKAAESSEIFKQEYEVGSHRVVFSSPYIDLSIIGATITNSSTYWVEFNVTTAQEVTLTGYTYDTVDNTVSRSRPYIDPGEVPNIKSFNTSLCNAPMATLLANKLLDYYSINNMTFAIKHIANDSEMNVFRKLENPYKQYDDFIAQFKKRSFNLTGGFIDTAELIGYFEPNDNGRSYSRHGEPYEIYMSDVDIDSELI